MILDLLEIRKDDSVVVVAPHPDDESLGTAGVLLQYPEQVDVYVVSDGSLGNPSIDPSEMAATRKAELARAMRLANPRSWHWLGFPDAHLAENPACVDAIDFTCYTIAFIPWADSLHPDHRALADFCLRRIREQGAACETFMYELQAPFRCPTHFINIAGVVARKRELVSCYHSTLARYPQDKVTLALNKFRSCQREEPFGWCECFLHVDAWGNVLPPTTRGAKMDVSSW